MSLGSFGFLEIRISDVGSGFMECGLGFGFRGFRV